MNVSLRQLEYFVSVAELGNFHRAAADCGVTQPGLSMQIRTLEDQVGLRLFERDRRRVLLTEAGKVLLHRARAVLAAVEDFALEAAAFGDPFDGDSRVGVIPTLAPYLLPRVLPVIRRRYPRLRLLLKEDRTAALVDALRGGDLDVALLALEAELGDLETLALFEDPFLVALPIGHPLAALDAIPFARLDGESVLLLDDGHCLRDQALSLCHQAGALEIGDFRAGSLTTLVQMVAGGVGLTLLPRLAASECRGESNLVLRPFAGAPPARTVGLAWRATSPFAAAFAELGAAIAEAHGGEAHRDEAHRDEAQAESP